MTAKGYLSNAATSVATFLGQTLTSGQQAQANALLESAEQVVDAYCHRAWLTGAITGERHEREAYWRGDLYVNNPPLTALTSVTGRAGLGADEVTLVSGTDFELVDATSGLIKLAAPWAYDRLLVSYTPVTTAPALLQEAVAELIAWVMQPALRPDSYGLYSVGLPDLQLRFAFHDVDDWPPGVKAKLDLLAFQGAF